jgi:hypothetical protein
MRSRIPHRCQHPENASTSWSASWRRCAGHRAAPGIASRRSLAPPVLLEETYEALEALDRGDLDSLREELGDLLFEIVFLARNRREGGHFSVADAAADVGAKLVRRHPHVFGDHARLKTAEEVRGKWEEMKAAEGQGPAHAARRCSAACRAPCRAAAGL